MYQKITVEKLSTSYLFQITNMAEHNQVLKSFNQNQVSNISTENMLDVIVACIDHIYDKKGEEVFDAKDSTKQELIDFVEQFFQDHIGKDCYFLVLSKYT